jgi:hypothetical protein
MRRAVAGGVVVAEPQDVLFPLAGALVLIGLAAGLTRRPSVLGRADADFMVAFVLVAFALLGAPLAAARGFDAASEVLVAAVGSGALLGTAGAALHAYGVRMARWFGEAGLRWGLLTGAVALVAFGWGAVATPAAVEGPGAPSLWPVIAVASVSVVTVGSVAIASLFARVPAVMRVQLLVGLAGLGVGFAALAIGSAPLAGASAMLGGGFVYSAVRGPERSSGGPQGPRSPPRGGDRKRGEPGVKVRVPKGSAQRVTRFRDDGLPPGGP